MDDTISREEDGTINAGYAVWRELAAELIAFELDDNCDMIPLRRQKRPSQLLRRRTPDRQREKWASA